MTFISRSRSALGCLVVSFLPLTAACSSSGDDDDAAGADTAIESTPLAGLISGRAWTMVSADTDAFLSDSDGYWATGYEVSISACSGQISDGRELLLTIPKTLGDHPLGLTLTATFYDPVTNDNLGATKGHIVVNSLSQTEIVGGAFIEFDAQNTVNGQFSIAICP